MLLSGLSIQDLALTTTMAQPTLLSQAFLPPSLWEGIYQSLCGREGTPVTPSFWFSAVLIATGLLILGAIALARWSTQHTLRRWQESQIHLQQVNASVQREVRDRQQAEAALQESTSRLALALKAAQAGTWQWNRVTHQVIWSEENFQLLGYDPQSCKASYENWLQAVHPDDRAAVQQHVMQVLEEKSDLNQEYRVLLPDGTVRWLADRGEVIYDGDGQPSGMIGIQIDITQRKQAELALQELNHELEARVQERTSALQESEARFRQLTETIQEVFWLFDPIHHQNLYVSPAYEQLWGQPLDTVYAHEWSWTDAIHPDDRDRVLALFANSKSWEHEVEYRILHSDGSVRWVRDRSFPLRNEQGEVYRVAGAAADITERKQLEAELQQTRDFLKTVIDHLPVAVFVKDGRAERFGEMLLWNQTSEQMFSLTAEQAVGKTVHDYFPKEQADFFEQKDREAFERGLLEDISEEPIDSYSLGRRLLHTVKVPLYDDRQQPQYLLCFSEDITERRQAELALRESERRLATLIDNLPGYVYRVANNPNYSPEFISEGVFAITGYRQEEYLINRSISCGQETHPEDAEAIWKIVQDAVAAHQPYECEYRIITKSGGQKSVWERGRGVYSDEGELICLEGFVTDISHYKQAEAALQQSEEHYRQLAEDTPALICQFLPDSTLTYVNSTYCQHFNQRPEQLLGRRFLEFLPSDAERQAVQANYLSLTPDAPSVMYEHPVTRPDGSVGWQRWVDRAFFDEQGQLTRIQSIGFDMTEAKRAEVELQVHQSRLDLALEAAQMGIWERDVETGEGIWSSREESLWGFEAGTFDGKLDSFLNRVHPDDRESLQQAEEEAIQTGSLQTEFRISLPDQTTQWIYCLGKVFYNEVGLPCRIVGVDLDITERKQAEAALRESEERLRLALMAANQGIYDLNVQTGEAIVSSEYALMLGYDPGTFQETNARWIERLHPEDHEHVVQTYQAYIAGEIPEYKVEFRQRTQTGDWKWILSLGRIVEWDNSGQPLRMLGTHSDIDDRKQSDVLLKVRAQQQSAIAQLGQLALAATDLLELMDAATALVAESLGVEYCKVLELLQDGTGLLLRAGVGWQPGLVGKAIVGLDQDSQAGYTLLIDQPVVVEELQTDQRFKDPALLQDHQVVSGLSVSIQGDDRPFGVLGAHSTRHCHFSQDDINFLQAVANILATAIARTRTEQELHQQKELLQTTFDHLPVMVGLYSAEGSLLMVNRELERTIGWEKVDYLTVNVLRECYPNLADYEQVLNHILTADSTWKDFKTLVRDGRILETSWAQIRLSDGRSIGIGQDITERKQVELALRESEAHFRCLATNIPGIVFQNHTTVEGGFAVLYASSGCSELYEVSAEEMLSGRYTFRDFEHPEDRPMIDQKIVETSQSLQPFNQEFRIVTLSGVLKWVHMISQPTLQADGSIVWDGIVQDVSDRKQAELELQSEQIRLQLALDAAQMGTWSCNLQADRLTWSDRTQKIFGFMPGTFAGDRDAFLTQVYPEDLDRVTRAISQCLETGNPYNIEHRIHRLDGEVRWLAVWGVISTEHLTTDQQLIGVVSDITDRKQAEIALQASEQRYRAIVEDQTELLLRRTPDHTVRFMNQAYCQFYGVTFEELIGQDLLTVVHESIRDWVRVSLDNITRSLTPENPTAFLENWVIDAKGQLHFYHFSDLVIFDADGRLVEIQTVGYDITDRKRAEDALQESETRFRQLAENIPEVFWVADSDLSQILYVSPAYESIWGCTCTSLYENPLSFTDPIHPEDRDRILSVVQQQRQQGWNEEYRIIQPSGTVRWIWEQSFPILENDGHVQRLVGICQDITDRKQAEESLSQLGIAVENAMTGISRLDSTGHFIMASGGYAQMLGYQPEELIGLSWADTVPQQDHQLGIAAAQIMLQHGRAEQELQAVRKDGSIFYKQILLVKSFNSRGEHDGHYCFMRDISERKQAELEIRQLNQVLEQQNRSLEALVEQRTSELLTFINALPDYIFVVERDGQRIPFCNDRLASVTLLGDRHAVQGRTLFDCFSAKEATYFAEQNRQVFESGELLHTQESIPLSTGQLHIDTYKIPLKHSNGEVYALICSSRDVTELVLARQSLTERTIQLEAINRELESFSYSVSHDLRAPLRHINGFVNALKLRLADHEALTDLKLVHYLDVIETSSKKMAQLIDGLLTLSRVGRKTMDYKPVNLRDLTYQAIELAQTSLETTTTVEFVIGELPTVRGDASLLQQVLSNLIENAVKFTHHQPAPRIEISSLSDGTIVVKDNGIGFETDYVDKLFEAFQRLHTQTEYVGTGIGLTIVKRIIHRHGGTIWAESQPNQGASFYFRLGEPA
jgi:PAS domain S-box-containing protein